MPKIQVDPSSCDKVSRSRIKSGETNEVFGLGLFSEEGPEAKGRSNKGIKCARREKNDSISKGHGAFVSTLQPPNVLDIHSCRIIEA